MPFGDNPIEDAAWANAHADDVRATVRAWMRVTEAMLADLDARSALRAGRSSAELDLVQTLRGALSERAEAVCGEV